MNRRTVRTMLIKYVLVLAILLAGGVQAASAQGTPAPETEVQSADIVFGVYPVGAYEGIYFEAFVEPGSTHEFNLALFNAGNSELSLLAYPADVYSMTNGGMGVHFQDQERTEPTTWIDFEEGVVEVAAGEELTQPFTASVPEGTPPGQYVTAIGVETADSYSVGDDAGTFRQVIRKVVAVVIIVPGEANPAFSLGAPEVEIMQGATVVRVPVENTGNIRVRPAGTLTLQDAEGNEVATGEITMGSVYMGHTAPFEVWLPNALQIGEYSVSVDLTDPETGVSASLDDEPVTVVPEATPVPIVVATPVPITPTPVPDPVTLNSVEIAENADPIQFANVAFDIENNGNHISRARVTLVVSHNGELIEEFVLEEHLPMPVGTTSVTDRYIPPTGWESGTWTFSITVHAINPGGNVETVVVFEEDIASIEVP